MHILCTLFCYYKIYPPIKKTACSVMFNREWQYNFQVIFRFRFTDIHVQGYIFLTLKIYHTLLV